MPLFTGGGLRQRPGEIQFTADAVPSMERMQCEKCTRRKCLGDWVFISEDSIG